MVSTPARGSLPTARANSCSAGAAMAAQSQLIERRRLTELIFDRNFHRIPGNSSIFRVVTRSFCLRRPLAHGKRNQNLITREGLVSGSREGAWRRASASLRGRRRLSPGRDFLSGELLLFLIYIS